jgi:hypothetical protein
MMRINFYDDPLQSPRPREDVRINQLGLHVFPDGRRVAVGFDITPFLERPSIDVTVTNGHGEQAASLTVIEAYETNFSLTMHLRDKAATERYDVRVELYYRSPEEGRQTVDVKTEAFNVPGPNEVDEPGEG